MTHLRLRLTASEGDTAAVINRLAAMKGIDAVEEIADLMPRMDDADSSSAGLPDDIGPGSHVVLVSANDEGAAREALEVAKYCARAMGLALETEESPG